MGVKSKIQWTEATWNPWHGCKKVSPGCKYCYMFRDKERFQQDPTTVLRSKANFYKPLQWNQPKLIFTCSWSDWFIEEADEWRPQAWEVIKRTPQHTYQILTKRPERIAEHLPHDWGLGYDNVWLGVSVESNDQRNRIIDLSHIPAVVKFVSAEPLIGKLDLFDPDNGFKQAMAFANDINWVIIGGESGNESGKYRYRECLGLWIDRIIDDCQICRVPVFIKQMGTALAKKMGLKDRHGGDMSEWPKHLQIRRMPQSYEIQQIL